MTLYKVPKVYVIRPYCSIEWAKRTYLPTSRSGIASACVRLHKMSVRGEPLVYVCFIKQLKHAFLLDVIMFTWACVMAKTNSFLVRADDLPMQCSQPHAYKAAGKYEAWKTKKAHSRSDDFILCFLFKIRTLGGQCHVSSCQRNMDYTYKRGLFWNNNADVLHEVTSTVTSPAFHMMNPVLIMVPPIMVTTVPMFIRVRSDVWKNKRNWRIC